MCNLLPLNLQRPEHQRRKRKEPGRKIQLIQWHLCVKFWIHVRKENAYPVIKYFFVAFEKKTTDVYIKLVT